MVIGTIFDRLPIEQPSTPYHNFISQSVVSVTNGPLRMSKRHIKFDVRSEPPRFANLYIIHYLIRYISQTSILFDINVILSSITNSNTILIVYY